MKISSIADIHGMIHDIELPKADVLVCAGDILSDKIEPVQVDELAKLDAYFGDLKNQGHYKEVIIVAGNHDFCFERMNTECRNVIKNSIYLQNEETVIDGVKFYGSPWTPWFWDWAFNFPDHNANFARARAHARACWEQIPDDTEVLITHGPPYGILDLNLHLHHTGCQWLDERIQQLKKLKLHIFGHIHYSAGYLKVEQVGYVNAAICGENYHLINPVISIEI